MTAAGSFLDDFLELLRFKSSLYIIYILYIKMKWYAYHSIIRPLGIWQRHLSRLSWSLGNNCYQGRKNLRPIIVAIATLNTPFFAWQPPPRLPSSRAAFYQSNGSFPSSEATFPQSAAIYPNGISHDAWQLWQMTASLFIRKQKEQHRVDAAPIILKCFEITYETSMALVTFCFGSVFGMVMVRMPSSTLAEIWSFTTSSGST